MRVLSVEIGSMQDLSVPFLGTLNTDPMPALRSSNLDRAAYRMKCRQKLSEHIRKIGLSRGEQELLTKSQSDQAWNLNRAGGSTADHK